MIIYWKFADENAIRTFYSDVKTVSRLNFVKTWSSINLVLVKQYFCGFQQESKERKNAVFNNSWEFYDLHRRVG